MLWLDIPRNIAAVLIGEWVLYKDLVYLSYVCRSSECRGKFDRFMENYCVELKHRTKSLLQIPEYLWVSSHCRLPAKCKYELTDKEQASIFTLLDAFWFSSKKRKRQSNFELFKQIHNLSWKNMSCLTEEITSAIACSATIEHVDIDCEAISKMEQILQLLRIRNGECTVYFRCVPWYLHYDGGKRALRLKSFDVSAVVQIFHTVPLLEHIFLELSLPSEEVANLFPALDKHRLTMKTATIDLKMKDGIHFAQDYVFNWIEYFPFMTELSILSSLPSSLASFGRLQELKYGGINIVKGMLTVPPIVTSSAASAYRFIAQILEFSDQFPIHQLKCYGALNPEVIHLLTEKHKLDTIHIHNVQADVTLALLVQLSHLTELHVVDSNYKSLSVFLEALAHGLSLSSVTVFCWKGNAGNIASWEHLAKLKQLAEFRLECTLAIGKGMLEALLSTLPSLPLLRKVVVPGLNTSNREGTDGAVLSFDADSVTDLLLLRYPPQWWRGVQASISIAAPHREGFQALLQSQTNEFELRAGQDFDLSMISSLPLNINKVFIFFCTPEQPIFREMAEHWTHLVYVDTMVWKVDKSKELFEFKLQHFAEWETYATADEAILSFESIVTVALKITPIYALAIHCGEERSGFEGMHVRLLEHLHSQVLPKLEKVIFHEACIQLMQLQGICDLMWPQWKELQLLSDDIHHSLLSKASVLRVLTNIISKTPNSFALRVRIRGMGITRDSFDSVRRPRLKIEVFD